MLPAVRAGEVDQLASGERGPQGVVRLLVEGVPAGGGDGCVAAEEVAHSVASLLEPFRLPMPSEPEPSGAEGAAPPEPPVDSSTSSTGSVVNR